MKNKQISFRSALSSLIVLMLVQLPTQVVAQTSAPSAVTTEQVWQQTATGLRGASSERKATAGLGFTVLQKDWPSLLMNGGVKSSVAFQYSNALIGPVGIDLGQIKVPGATGAFSSERTDWAHNEMTFTYSGGALAMWASRLSPAVLVQSPSNALRLLAGNVSGNTVTQDGRLNQRASGPSSPKYAAFPTGGAVQVAALGAANTPLSLSSNWLLVWYSSNSHFADTKKPLTYGGMSASYAYQGDVPILLVFQNTPTGIKQGSDGGIELAFGGAAGYVAVLPLFGRNSLPTSQTAGWAAGLPADVRQRAEGWAARLCSYPASAAETYAYDEGADLATITEDINFIQVCNGGMRFAPLPPMLAIAKDALEIGFSGTVVDGNLPTEFGPSLGIENVQKYSWRMQGLQRYADSRRQLGAELVPADIQQELTDQINKVVAAGHLRPWLFMDAAPVHTNRGDAYWANPADTLHQLAEVAEVVTDSAAKQSLVTYMRAERTKYPPEDVFNLNPTEGAVRSSYSSYAKDWEYAWTVDRTDALQQRVPLWSLYGLSKYYDLTGDAVPKMVLDKANQVLDRDMREQDWATSYWFDGFQDRTVAVVNVNRHFAGLVGYARLAKQGGDGAARAQIMPLLAKAAVLRVGLAQYPRYLYSAGLVELPPNRDWMVKNTAQTWNGHLFNFDWASADDDARQVTFLTQYGVFLYDHSGTQGGNSDSCCGFFPYLTAYRDLTPELARLLVDHAKTDAEIYARKVKALYPHWYAAFAEGTLGHEHNLNHPVDSYQTFLAEAWITGAPARDLALHADIPWLELGDLFYMRKLAEVVRAYRTGGWDGALVHAEAGASPASAARKGDKVTLSLKIISDVGPITTTIRMTSVVPAGLSYVPGSLKVDPANAGAANASQIPTLVWQGTLDASVTIRYDVQVTESAARSIDVSFVVEDKPGRIQTYRQVIAVNLQRVCLPVVMRE